MASIYTRETENGKNNFEYKKYYKENKARISRRRVLLAISKGRCASEKTLHNPKYQWNDAEKERLRECIKRRRESYLTLPIGEFQDKRYYLNNQTDRRSFQRSTPKRSSIPQKSPAISPSGDIQMEIPPQSLPDDTSTQVKTRGKIATASKMIKRSEVKLDVPVKPPDSKEKYTNRLTEKLVIEMLTSLYHENGSRYKQNQNETRRNFRKLQNSNTVKKAFEYMEIDDALDIFRYPVRAVAAINWNLQYINMLNYVKIFTDITNSSKNNHFKPFIDSNPSYSWLEELTTTENYIKDSSIVIIRDKVDSMKRNKFAATVEKLKTQPCFNWQHICNTINLVEKHRFQKNEENHKDEKNVSRLLIQLYTRELVVRDDYGSFKLYQIKDQATLTTLKNNEFLKQSVINCIFQVNPKIIDIKGIEYVDKVSYFTAAAGNTLRSLNIVNKHQGIESPFAYILYFMHFKTYVGFDGLIRHPFLLKDKTSDYIYEYLKNRKLSIPNLPKNINQHKSEEDVFLFGKKDGKNNKPYLPKQGGKLGSKISSMFEKLTKIPITINDLRHSYASYFRTTYKKNEDGEHESVVVSAAHRMFHTYLTHINSYTHTSNTIYKFEDDIHKQINYEDKIVKETLVTKSTHNPKLLGFTGTGVCVKYHIRTTPDNTVVSLDMNGTVVWDERDTLQVENEEDSDDDDTNIVTGGVIAVQKRSKAVKKSRDAMLNVKKKKNVVTTDHKYVEKLLEHALDVKLKRKTETKSIDYQIRIHFNDSTPDLLTNTSNPFLIFQTSKKKKSLIDYINQKFDFPNYSNEISKSRITDTALLNIHVPIKLEVARLRRFEKGDSERKKNANMIVYKHFPDQLKAVRLEYNTNESYAYDRLNMVEYPFVLTPDNLKITDKRKQQLYYRYLTIEDLESFIKIVTKQNRPKKTKQKIPKEIQNKK